MESTLVTVLRSTNYPVYSLSIPANGEYPCIVYQMVSNLNLRNHTGNHMQRPRIQISCWAETYGDALTVADAVKTALDLNQVNFKLATLENELDDKEVETNLYRKLLDFYVWD